MTCSNVLLSYEKASRLVSIFEKRSDDRFSTKEYCVVASAFSANGEKKNQDAAFSKFEGLNKSDLMSRCSKIDKLYNMMINIKINARR